MSHPWSHRAPHQNVWMGQRWGPEQCSANYYRIKLQSFFNGLHWSSFTNCDGIFLAFIKHNYSLWNNSTQVRRFRSAYCTNQDWQNSVQQQKGQQRIIRYFRHLLIRSTAPWSTHPKYWPILQCFRLWQAPSPPIDRIWALVVFWRIRTEYKPRFLFLCLFRFRLLCVLSC